MTKWEYLTLRIKWVRPEEGQTNSRGELDIGEWKWFLDGAHAGPYEDQIAKYKPNLSPERFIQSVLGPEGWELVTIEDLARELVGNAGLIDSTRYWFKRPAE